jgi:hypothetical protein
MGIAPSMEPVRLISGWNFIVRNVPWSHTPPSFFSIAYSLQVLGIGRLEKPTVVFISTRGAEVLDRKKSVPWCTQRLIWECIRGTAFAALAAAAFSRTFYRKISIAIFANARLSSVCRLCQLATRFTYENIFGMSCCGSQQVSREEVNGFVTILACNIFYPKEILHMCILFPAKNTLGAVKVSDILLHLDTQ